MSEVLMLIIVTIGMILIATFIVINKISKELKDDELFKQEMNKYISSSTSTHD